MFNWVCPRCGKDVPPSKTECPFCAEAGAAAPVPAGYPPPAPAGYPPPPPVPPQAQAVMHPPPQQYAAPVQYAPQPQYAPPPPGWPPPQRQGAPTWLLGVAFGLAFVGIFAAIYLYLNHQPSAPSAGGAPQTAATGAPPAANPLQKYIEIAGVRLVTENKRAMARFIVVNHSGAEMSGVSGKVTLLAGNSRADATPVGSFDFTVKSLPASGSADLSAPFETKMKAYELPDWQAAFTQVEITSPAP